MIAETQQLVVPDGSGTLPVPSGGRWAWFYGSDVTLPVEIVHADGSAYDLSGSVAALLGIYLNESDPTPILQLEWTITDAVDGLAKFVFTRDLAPLLPPGDYVVGVQFRDDDTEIEDTVWSGGTLTLFYRPANFALPVTVPGEQFPLAQGPNLGHSDTFADFPAASTKPWLFWEADNTHLVYYSDSTTWRVVGSGGGAPAVDIIHSPSTTWSTDIEPKLIANGNAGVVEVVTDETGAASVVDALTIPLTNVRFVGRPSFLSPTNLLNTALEFASGVHLVLDEEEGAYKLVGTTVAFKGTGPIVPDGQEVYVVLRDNAEIMGPTGMFPAQTNFQVDMDGTCGLNVDGGAQPLVVSGVTVNVFATVNAQEGDQIGAGTFGVGSEGATTASFTGTFAPDPASCEPNVSIITQDVGTYQTVQALSTVQLGTFVARVPGGYATYNVNTMPLAMLAGIAVSSADASGDWFRMVKAHGYTAQVLNDEAGEILNGDTFYHSTTVPGLASSVGSVAAGVALQNAATNSYTRTAFGIYGSDSSRVYATPADLPTPSPFADGAAVVVKQDKTPTWFIYSTESSTWEPLSPNVEVCPSHFGVQAQAYVMPSTSLDGYVETFDVTSSDPTLCDGIAIATDLADVITLASVLRLGSGVTVTIHLDNAADVTGPGKLLYHSEQVPGWVSASPGALGIVATISRAAATAGTYVKARA